MQPNFEVPDIPNPENADNDSLMDFSDQGLDSSDGEGYVSSVFECELSSDSDDSDGLQEEENVHIFWRGRAKELKILSIGPESKEKCILCETESAEKSFLNLDLVYDVCETSSLAIQNWSQKHYLCKLCFQNRELSNVGKDILTTSHKIIISSPLKKFSLGMYPQDRNDKFVAKKEREKLTLNEALAKKGLHNLNFMTDTEINRLCFHSKRHILELMEYAKAKGLKKGSALGLDQKVIIFLAHLKTNLSTYELASIFKVSQSTIVRCRNAVENSLSDFTAEFSVGFKIKCTLKKIIFRKFHTNCPKKAPKCVELEMEERMSDCEPA